jgi:hypothetical protein
MSSATVRTAFRQAVATGFPSVPYFDTIAHEVTQETLPTLWMTLEFAPLSETRETIDPPSYWEERGICYVVIANEAGNGDTAAVEFADTVRAYFRNWNAPGDPNFVVEEVTAPTQPDAESEGRWFFVVVGVQYKRGFFE